MQDAYIIIEKKYRTAVQLGNFRAAQNALDKLIQINPAKGWYHSGLFIAMLEKKPSRKPFIRQVSYFKKSLQSDPSNQHAWRALAMAYIKLKKYTDARSAIEQAMKLSPTIRWHNDNKRFLTNILIDTGKYREAKKVLD